VLSLAVAALYLMEIYLSRRIINEQHFLVDQREIADTGAIYKEGWQKLAVESWKASHEDPTMLDYLKSEGVNVHQGAPPASEPATTNAAPQPAAPTETSAETPPQPSGR